jgi:hypothetical protein
MVRRVVLICLLAVFLPRGIGQVLSNKDGVSVEVVATASEYIPRSATVSHPGHAYTNCMGSTSYFGRFSSYGDSGSVSGTAETNTDCKTIFSPPTDTTLTTYHRVNYTIAKGENVLYLLSCTQRWKPTRKERFLAGLAGGIAGGSGGSSEAADKIEQKAAGTWSDCPAFAIGSNYTLSVRNTSDARLDSAAGSNPAKLDYLSSAALPVPSSQSASQPQPQAVSTSDAKVHITSTPSGGEIYIDGKFFGNTPSDITLTIGEHVVKVTIGGKEWSRSVQITTGEIRVHADITGK